VSVTVTDKPKLHGLTRRSLALGLTFVSCRVMPLGRQRKGVLDADRRLQLRTSGSRQAY